MTKYKITGYLGKKKYLSRTTFNNEKDALKYAYKNLIYNPSGNTKRKTQLTNFKLVKVK